MRVKHIAKDDLVSKPDIGLVDGLELSDTDDNDDGDSDDGLFNPPDVA